MLLTLDTFADKGNHDLEPRPSNRCRGFRVSGLEVARSPATEHPALYTTAQEALASRPAPVRVVGINSGSESMAMFGNLEVVSIWRWQVDRYSREGWTVQWTRFLGSSFRYWGSALCEILRPIAVREASPPHA